MNSFLTVPISQKFSDIIPHFLFSFASHHTRRSYLNDLRNFYDFVNTTQKNINLLSDIDDICVSHWKAYLENDLKLDPSSVRRKLNCLSALFAFAQKRKFIDVNPVQWVKKPMQKHTSITNELTPDEMKKIFLNIEENIEKIHRMPEKDIHYKRTLHSLELQYAILKLLYGTGIRVSEVCHLKLSDIEIQENNIGEKTFVLHIAKAKGSKEHKLYLNQKTATIILNYIDKYKTNSKKEDYLFSRVQRTLNSNTPVTAKAIYNMVTSNAAQANIIKKVSPHSIRAGVATLLHSKGVPLARIQKQLGHSDISTTSIYIKKSNEIEESAALKLNLDDN